MLNLDKEGRWTDCSNEPICYNPCNPSCSNFPVKVGRSQVGILHYVRQLSTEGMTSEEVLALWREGKLWQRTDHLRKCAVCGKVITSGYVWDGTDTFCSEECAASPFENPYTGEQGDPATLEMLIDEGRMVWHDEFND